MDLKKYFTNFFKAGSVLERISFLYLVFPIIVFTLNWIHLYLAVPLIMYLFWYLHKYWPQEPITESQNFKITWPLFMGFVLLIIWIWFSGIGAFSFQNGDYQKHHAILHDLIDLTWPVRYEVGEFESRQIFLVYYIGFYLPAALVGKLTSFAVAQVCLFLWSCLGLGLGLMWLFRLIKKQNFRTILIFIFFSGLDVIGYALTKGKIPSGGEHIEWWGKVWQFSAMSSQLYWVPQHAIISWLLAPIFIYNILKKRTTLLPLYLVFSMLWSPFVSIGLGVYFLYSLYKEGFREYFKLHKILLPSLFFIVFCAYFASRIPDPYKAFLLTSSRWSKIFPMNFVFLVLEIGFFVVLLFNFIPKLDKRYRELFKLTALTLPLFTIYKLGMYNDFCMRGSMPGLYVLMFFVILFFNNGELLRNSLPKQLLLIVLFLGAGNALQEISRSIVNNHLPRYGKRRVIKQDFRFARQYVGMQNSMYFRYLMPDSPAEKVKISSSLRNVLVESNSFLKPGEPVFADEEFTYEDI